MIKLDKNILKEISGFVMSFFYIYVGIKHFYDPSFFLQIMPPYIPYHLELVYISGGIEIFLGVFLIIKKTREYAAFGIIVLLVAVFPANTYLAETNGAAMNISPEIAWGRLPIQLIFLGLAYWHSIIDRQ